MRDMASVRAARREIAITNYQLCYHYKTGAPEIRKCGPSYRLQKDKDCLFIVLKKLFFYVFKNKKNNYYF